MSLEYIALIVSIVAIIISASSFLVAYRVMRRDRGDLSISCTYLPESDLGLAFLIKVVNSGRRQKTVSHIYLATDSGHQYSYLDLTQTSAQFPHLLPARLEESEPVEVLMPIWPLRPKIYDPRKFRWLIVKDSLDKSWRIPLKKIVKKIPYSEEFDRSE